jgi:pilus assembly protein CpaD
MTRIVPPTVCGLIALLALPLSACAPDRIVTGSTYPMDYRERHPIILANAADSLDVFVAPAGLDPRQRTDVAAFALEYRRRGESFLTVQVPEGARNGLTPRRARAIVEGALAEAGIPRSQLVVSNYQVSDPFLASPVRLSFKKLQAEVGHPCGLWPQDLGVSDVGFNARNEPYWNLCCAMQSNVAQQVADPIDFVRGRSESRVDTIRRMRNIEKLRVGVDPSTQYRRQDDKISNTIGN